MTKEREYREHAAEMLGLAQRASSGADKARLLRIAEAWLDLSDRIRTGATRLRHRPAESPADQPRDLRG
jgi:hypothetical protein